MDNSIEIPVRQSAAIYLKNAVIRDWEAKEAPAGQPLEFSIHEQDKAVIRDSIVDAVVLAPENLRVHLGVCVNYIVKYDFPTRWTNIVDKISVYLQMPDRQMWAGALYALYQLVKVFEYKSEDERAPIDDAMNLLLPLLRAGLNELMPDDSNDSLLIQKQILKILYAVIQYHLPQKLFTKEVFLSWMEALKQVVERDIPTRVDQVEEDDKPEEPAWKCKKWALHLLARVFERYGSPGSVSKQFKPFSDWYIKTFSMGIITALLKILEQYGNNKYVAPRVLQQTLNYITTSVNNAFSWKLVKLHINLIIQNIVFPLLCYTKEDQQLWEEDPQEYIRMKFDVFEDYVSPVTAAQNLLHTTCKKRKGMLENTLAFVVQVLNNTASEPRMRDGALHMVGAVADVLLKKEVYKNQMENMLVAYVFPHFESEFGYLRARACWVLNYFADIHFENDLNGLRALELVQKCILNETELPVKVEAAICFQTLVTSQDKIHKLAEQNIALVALEILRVIRETENEDLANVMQKLICLYTDHLVPIAVEMTQHLAQTFEQLTQEGTEENDDRSLTAMSLLNTIDTIVTMMQDQKEMILALEPIVVQIVVRVFQKEMIDLYEETLTLIYTISSVQVSPDLWRLFEMMYQIFNKEGGMDYFVEMMPALHNFITVDPATFISNQHHVLAIYNMCKAVMESNEVGEDAQTHAAKLLECLLFQFKGQIDQCVHPFVELVLSRLTRGAKCDELRTMCLQVVIAALWYNNDLLMETLHRLQPPGSNQPIFDHLLKTWIDDTHCFQGLHDRKVSVLGLVILLSLPPNKRPQAVNSVTSQLLPTILQLFEGLKVAYQSKAAADQESEEDDEEEEEDSDDSEPEDLEDDEDHIPGSNALKSLVAQINSSSPFPIVSATMEEEEADEESDDDDDEEDEFEQTALESYTTPIDEDETPVDEYVLFKETMELLQQREQDWFQALMSPLSPDQQKVLQDVYTLAQQRKAAAGKRYDLYVPD